METNNKEVILRIYDPDFMPEPFKMLKEDHYKAVLGEYYKEAYEESKKFNAQEKTLIAEVDKEPVARCIAEYNRYDIRIRDFTVLKKARGSGVASRFLEMIEQEASKHHDNLKNTLYKPYDMMLIRTYIYLDGDQESENFEMGKFLKKKGFSPYRYNPKALTPVELKAIDALTKINPEYVKILKVFKKYVIRNMEPRYEIRNELMKLDKEHKSAMLKKLEAKLAAYETEGCMTSRCLACNLSEDVKGAKNKYVANGCCLRKICSEPIGEWFENDSELSYEYFSKTRQFLAGEGK